MEKFKQNEELVEDLEKQEEVEMDSKNKEKKEGRFPSLESLRLSQDFSVGVGLAEKVITTIPVRKPGRSMWIRVHPSDDYYFETAIYEDKEQGETYLISNRLWEGFAEELVLKSLYFYITRQGDVCLWPVKLSDYNGRLDNWNASAHEAAQIAKEKWVRVASNRSLGAYDVYTAKAEIEEPVWPDMRFEKIIEIAFKDRFIDSIDHIILRKLRGEA